MDDNKLVSIMRGLLVVVSEYVYHFFRFLRISMDGLLIIILSLLHAVIPIKLFRPDKNFKYFESKSFLR